MFYSVLKKMLSCFKGNAGCVNARHHVLVVDDGESERTFYSRALKRAGYTVDTASCADDAIELIRQRRPDAILMDFSMPGMNGNDLCRHLKDTGLAVDVPVIFLTGSTRPDDVVDCFDAGGEHFLTKPIRAKSLVRQVAAVISDFECRQPCGQTQ